MGGNAVLGAGLKLLSGLFGKKPRSPAQNIMSQAKGVMRASAATGLHPLTLLQYGNSAGSMDQGGPPPLASLGVLGDAILEAEDPEKKARTTQTELQNDLLRLEVSKAHAGVVAQPRAVDRIGQGVAQLGSAVTVVERPEAVSSSVVAGFGVPQFNAALTPGRDFQVTPQKSESGIIQIDNAVTGPLKFFGTDGEIAVEYLQIPLLGGPQVLSNWGQPVLDGISAGGNMPQSYRDRARDAKAKGDAYLESERRKALAGRLKPYNLRFDPYKASGYF